MMIKSSKSSDRAPRRHVGLNQVMRTLRMAGGESGFSALDTTPLRYGRARTQLSWSAQSAHELHMDFEAGMLSLRLAPGDEHLQFLLSNRADRVFGVKASARNRPVWSDDPGVQVRSGWDRHGFALHAHVLRDDYSAGVRSLLRLGEMLLGESPFRGLGSDPCVRRLRVS